MSSDPKDPRSAAMRARDTASIVGSLIHEGYVVTGGEAPIFRIEAAAHQPAPWRPDFISPNRATPAGLCA